MFNLTFQICIAFFVVIFSTRKISGVEISSNGGYNIQLAFSGKFSTIHGNNLELTKSVLSAFSQKLWHASKHTFWINQVDILIPNEWKDFLGIETELATSQTYGSADIRVSSNFENVFVDNPHLCGEAGNYMNVPLELFVGDLTSPEKAFLHYWARLRYGVWEENGFPGDEQFPYFYKMENASHTKYLITGCSDVKINGQILDESGEPCILDDMFSEPNVTCRLKPDAVQEAKSSLMHFHWLESVEEFCDETNHNADAPNRQNVYCNGSSVWEVIRGTEDYISVTNPSETLPEVTFKVVAESDKPLLYIVLESSEPFNQEELLAFDEIKLQMRTFLTDQVLNGTVAKLMFSDGSGGVKWSSLAEKRDEFLEEMNKFGNPWGVKMEMTSFALYDALKEIYFRNPAAGCILLVCKKGTETSVILSQETRLKSLLKRRKVKIFGMEIGFQTNQLTLRHLVQETEGSHQQLADSRQISEQVSNLLNEVRNTLQTEMNLPEKSKWHLVANEKIDENDEFLYYVSFPKVVSIEFEIVTDSSTIPEVFITPPNSLNNNITISKKNRTEWSNVLFPEGSSARRIVLLFTVEIPEEFQEKASGIWTVMCEYDGTVSGSYYGGVYAKTKEGTSVQIDEDVTIDVSFFKLDKWFNFLDYPVVYGIHATVLQNGVPVRLPPTWDFVMTWERDGEQNNDGYSPFVFLYNIAGVNEIDRKGGIYSDSFLPDEPGLYTFSIFFQGDIRELGNVSRRVLNGNEKGKFPFPEEDFTLCGLDRVDSCQVGEYMKPFNKMVILPDKLKFESQDIYYDETMPVQRRILDLTAKPRKGFPEVILSFSESTFLVGFSQRTRKYLIVYTAESKNDLLVPEKRMILGNETCERNGTGCDTTWTYGAMFEFAYYAVEYHLQRGPTFTTGLSNIVSCRIEGSIPTTTTKGTTTEPTEEPTPTITTELSSTTLETTITLSTDGITSPTTSRTTSVPTSSETPESTPGLETTTPVPTTTTTEPTNWTTTETDIVTTNTYSTGPKLSVASFPLLFLLIIATNY